MKQYGVAGGVCAVFTLLVVKYKSGRIEIAVEIVQVVQVLINFMTKKLVELRIVRLAEGRVRARSALVRHDD